MWLNNQSEQGYRLAYKNVFHHYKDKYLDFKLGDSLLAVIVDWSDAEINGLKTAIGDKLAISLLRECKVHWICSCQRVADRVASQTNKDLKKKIFLKN